MIEFVSREKSGPRRVRSSFWPRIKFDLSMIMFPLNKRAPIRLIGGVVSFPSKSRAKISDETDVLMS